MTVRIRYAETLDKQGRLYVENLRSARATDYFTTAKDGVSEWEPRFTFHGFRHVEVAYHAEKDAVALAPDPVTGVVLHTDMPATGSFECSDPLINQLQSNIQWGQRGNYLEIPTDCPQRDERLGWTGDAQVFMRTGAFNFEVAGFFTKWIQDITDAQAKDGRVPVVIPDHNRDGSESPAWSDAVVICPWTLYRCYGDASVLGKHYGMMKKYVDYLAKEATGLIRRHTDTDEWGGFGDWLAMDGSGKWDGGTPKDLIGTAYFAYSTKLLAQTAGVLGKRDDAARYERLFSRIQGAFQKRFINREGFVGSGTQTGYVLALHFGLMPETLRGRAVAKLVRNIKRCGNKLATGFVGTSFLPYVLSDNGRTDVAFTLLNQKAWPSWLYAVTKGATTIWERWDGWTEDKGFQDVAMNSFNHYAYGAIGEWLYARVAGLALAPEVPAYKHILFRPTPGGGLTRARARMNTPYGWAESSWRMVGKQFIYHVLLPPNTTGEVLLPGSAKRIRIGAGRHQFKCPAPG